MAAKSRSKTPRTVYRVTFTAERELYQVCARHVAPSDLTGLIEIGDFLFTPSKLVYNPGEERLRREFESIRRTWLPYHAIVRIDELVEGQEADAKIIPLDAATRPHRERPRSQPD